MSSMRGIAVAAAAMVMAAAPTAALAASYFVLTVDKTSLTMTDLRSPRLIKDGAQIFEVVIYRTPTKGPGKPAGKKADYLIVQTNFDCAKDKLQRQYTAAYDAGGGFLSSDIKPGSWTKVKPDTKDATLKALGCSAAKPQAGFPLGDVRVGKVMTDYRAGVYDRYIH